MYNLEIENAAVLEIPRNTHPNEIYNRSSVLLQGKPFFVERSGRLNARIFFDVEQERWTLEWTNNDRLFLCYWNGANKPDGNNQWTYVGKEVPSKYSLLIRETLPPSMKKAHNGFATLWMNETYSDLIFKLRDGSTIPAHRCVISVQCPAWGGLLKSQMQETREGVIHLDDFSPDLGREFIKSLYCGSVRRAYLVDVLALADCYQISWLVERCVDELIGNLDTTNIFAQAFEFIRLHPSPPERLVQHMFVKIRGGLLVSKDEQMRVMFGIGMGNKIPAFIPKVQCAESNDNVMESESSVSEAFTDNLGNGNSS